MDGKVSTEASEARKFIVRRRKPGRTAPENSPLEQHDEQFETFEFGEVVIFMNGRAAGSQGQTVWWHGRVYKKDGKWVGPPGWSIVVDTIPRQHQQTGRANVNDCSVLEKMSSYIGSWREEDLL